MFVESSIMCPSQGDFSNVDGMEINERNKILLFCCARGELWLGGIKMKNYGKGISYRMRGDVWYHEGASYMS